MPSIFIAPEDGEDFTDLSHSFGRETLDLFLWFRNCLQFVNNVTELVVRELYLFVVVYLK